MEAFLLQTACSLARIYTCPVDVVLTELQYHLMRRSHSKNAQLLILGKVTSFPIFFFNFFTASGACLNCSGGGLFMNRRAGGIYLAHVNQITVNSLIVTVCSSLCFDQFVIVFAIL